MAITRLQREFIEHLMLREQGSGISDAEFGRIIGVDNEVLKGWKKSKGFKAALERERERWKTLSPFERRTHLWAIEEAIKNYTSCKKDNAAEKRHWWKLLMETTKTSAEDTSVIDYSSYTDDDLWNLIEERGLQDEALRIQSELGGK
jgi:hypothetical protein